MVSGQGDISFKAKGAPSASPLGAGRDAVPGKLQQRPAGSVRSLDWDSKTVSGFWEEEETRSFSNVIGLMNRKQDMNADRVQQRHLDLANRERSQNWSNGRGHCTPPKPMGRNSESPPPPPPVSFLASKHNMHHRR